MVDWLDGFEVEAGQLKARLRSGGVMYQSEHLADLRDRGVPNGGRKIRRAFDTCFQDWTQVPESRYLSAFKELGTSAVGHHTVFSLRCGRSELLVPALVLLRGLFPVVAQALAYAFTPRPLEALCIPITRGGHWTVWTPNLTGLYNARFRRPSVEALTWASLYPTARRTWHSVYLAALEGRMSLDLPDATARVVPYGVRVGSTVHVTRLLVNALLAHDSALAFAAAASRSFVFMTNSEPLAPGPNAYYETHEASEATRYRLSDEEWAQVKPFLERPAAARGRCARHAVRDVADGLAIREATCLPWADIPVPIAANALAGHAQEWRADGRFDRLVELLQASRGDLRCPVPARAA